MKKIRKSVVVMVWGTVLIGAILTGCREKDRSQSVVQEEQKDTDAEGAETEAAEKDSQIQITYEDDFDVDSDGARKFAEKVKAAAADKDLEALAALTAFPVYVGLPDVGVVETKDDLLKLGAEEVFTEELQRSVEMAAIDDLKPSMAGFSISDGGACNINFGVRDGVLAINGINYQ